MVELFNEDFVKGLKAKNVNIVDRIFEYMMDIPGIQMNAYKEAESILRDMLTNPKKPTASQTQQEAAWSDNLQRAYGKSSDFDANGKPKPEVLKEIEAEKATIKADAKANGTWLKAPNGEQSDLNEEQWVMVKTSRFKANFFGDWEAEPEHNFNFEKNRFHFGYNRNKTRLGNRGTMEGSTPQ